MIDSINKVVVVTGAADGIGWATSQCLAANGWIVALTDKNADVVVERAEMLGHPHTGWGCDVTEPAQVKECISAIKNKYGRIDALVNNAGIGDQALPTLEQDIHAFDRVLSVHLRGTFLVTQQVLSHMSQQDRDQRGVRGAIVNIGSIASFGGIPGRNAYSAAKAGVIGMTKSLASEWARKGIRINAVAPGYVKTALVAKLADQGALSEPAINKRTPLGRMAEPAEIGEAISFLVSNGASYITGAVLPVDGGWMALGAPDTSMSPIEP
jgi:NAD(P)-dependent dehydrogenase (short-subunit alcohol dehydrogenase family)